MRFRNDFANLSVTRLRSPIDPAAVGPSLIPEQAAHGVDVGKGHIDVLAHDPQFLARDGKEHQRDRPDDEGLACDPAALGLPPRDVTLLRGENARIKLIAIATSR